MTEEELAKEQAALAELDKLTAAYRAAEKKLDNARDLLHEAIIKHLRERNARPGKIAEHSPYDRNHVGRIGKAAGIQPLRKKTVQSIRATGDRADHTKAASHGVESTGSGNNPT